MRSNLKKIGAFLLILVIVVGGIQVLASDEKPPAPAAALLGGSATAFAAPAGNNVTVMIKNVEGGYLQVDTGNTAPSSRKLIPIGMETEVPLDNGFVSLSIFPYGYNEDMGGNGQAIVSTNIEVKTASGEVLTPTYSRKGAQRDNRWTNPDNAISSETYKISESVTITSQFEIVDLIPRTPEPGSKYLYVGFKNESDGDNLSYMALEKGKSVNISAQMATFLDSGTDEDSTEMPDFTYSKKDPTDSVWTLFDISASGMLTSKAPVTEVGYYDFDIIGTHADGRIAESSYVDATIGKVTTYRFYLISDVSRTIYDTTDHRYNYTDTTFGETKSKAIIDTDQLHGLVFTGTWLTRTGRVISDSDQLLLRGSASVYAQYKDAAGTIYSVPALALDGGVIPPVTPEDPGPEDPDPVNPGDPGNPNPPNPLRPVSPSSGGSGSGRGSSSGAKPAKNTVDTSPNVKTPVSTSSKKSPVDDKTALAAFDKALGTGDMVTVKFRNPESITAAAAKAMIAKAGGKAVLIHADSLTANNSVDVRMILNAADIKANLGLNASTQSQKSRSIQSLFLTHFKAVATVISTNQDASFGAEVEYAVKIDPALNKETLVFYTHNATLNKYQPFTPTKQWMDNNGYLHLVTKEAGSIVITDRVLSK